MASVAADLIAHALGPLARWLDDPATEEVCVNAPGVAFIRAGGRWSRAEVPVLDFRRLEGVAILAGALRGQDVNRDRPLLATELPGGLRLQALLPPAVPAGTVSLTFRKPGGAVAALEDAATRYRTEGWNRWAGLAERKDRGDLLTLFDAGDLGAFLRAAVRARLNILLCGSTGSGKTTMGKTLLAAIPDHERLLTIEDTLELVVPQPNHVRLLYSKGGLAGGSVSAVSLLEASLRMRPDRVILQELRDDAAWTYVQEVMTGHPGSITTIHGGDPAQAFKRLFTLVKGSPQGAGWGDASLANVLAAAVDLVVPFHNDGLVYSVRETWFAADAARRGETALDLIGAGQ